jgi:hypothetical protein
MRVKEHTMAINLGKIQGDLGHADPQIQTFALISVTRLAPNLVEGEEEVRQLFSRLEQLIRSDNPDVVFLARKASNHLRAHFRGALGEARPRPRPGKDANPATMKRVELLASLAGCEDPQRLSSLIIRLVEHGSSEDLKVLAGYLKHSNDRVRSNALEVFVRWGDASHLPLVRPLAEDPSNRVRGTALLALERFGDPRVPEYLAAMLHLPQISMRETSVWVLSQIDKDWVAGLLVRAMEDPYDGIRLRVVRSLAKYPTRESVRALKQAMNDIDINICEAAAESLRALKLLIQGAQAARQKETGAEQDLVQVEATKPVEAVASQPQPEIQEAAADSRVVREKQSALRDLGTAIYQLCRLNAITHESLDETFYEILRYQDFLRGFLIQNQKSGEAGGGDLTDKIRQLQVRIAHSFVTLGEIAEGLLSKGDIRIPSDQQAEVGGILARIRS